MPLLARCFGEGRVSGSILSWTMLRLDFGMLNCGCHYAVDVVFCFTNCVLAVIFGEIAPQSICVRYGLPIGAWMAPFVLCLMFLLAPVAWPTAKLLDYLLGEDHGTTYKKAGLKTLVTLHRTLGESPTERLNQDEVTIISAVLDLKEKPVGSIMTPMSDVFTLSTDTVLDEAMMDGILSEGYSRIPIHAVDKPRDFVGMLLVKMLITYDPEDCLRVRDFQLATLPETRPETSCLDIVNFFQEGKSHMVLVSDSPGEDYGALGVVTLEDVIEELIGEEIVDESDVFIDVHKAIRRLHPAPRYRIGKNEIMAPPDSSISTQPENHLGVDIDSMSSKGHSRSASVDLAKSPPPPGSTLLMRRRSSGAEPFSVRSRTPEMRQHLKHLGPSNVASRPKSTRINTVKIKPGIAGPALVDQMVTVPETSILPREGSRRSSRTPSIIMPVDINESTGLLSAGRIAKDGVHALGYGALSSSPATQQIPDFKPTRPPTSDTLVTKIDEEPTLVRKDSSPAASQKSLERRASALNKPPPSPPAKFIVDITPYNEGDHNVNITTTTTTFDKNDVDGTSSPHRPSVLSRRGSGTSMVGSLRSYQSGDAMKKVTRMNARSGSITEHTIEVGGVKKIVLETTSSSDDEGHRVNRNASYKSLTMRSENSIDKAKAHEDGDKTASKSADGAAAADGEGGNAPVKKRKKKRAGKKKAKGKEGAAGEDK
jgi:metal transporter CNNM